MFRICSDKRLVEPDAAGRDIDDALIVDFRIMRENNFVKIDMKFTVFHVVDTGKDGGAGSLVENCRSFGTGQGAIKKQHTGATTGVALIEADDEQSVIRQGLFIGLHSVVAAEMGEARSVATALAHEEVVR